ncbi:NADH-quinone oxidoreductase subunit L [Anaerovibrio slackiae]|uniref:NADH-quinone oxidoreductase subunit L n=1 Tax=Anaerovibrio slackiae TaxID=2652309 RepID=UPI0038687586
MFNEFALEHAWLIPLLPALAFVVIGMVTRSYGRLSAAIAVSMSALSFLLAAGTALAVVEGNITVEAPFIQKVSWFHIGIVQIDMGVLVDPLTAMMLMVVTTVSLLVQIYSCGYMKGDPGYGRFFAFLSLFAGSMLGLVVAVNFLQLYFFWELVGLCSYLLIGFYYHKVSAREAAKKAFMTTRVGDFGLLLGILLLQLTFGTLDFQALQSAVPAYVVQCGTGFLTVIALLLFVGPIGKSGQFPLHVWLPDAMEGPTPVSALIHAATMVVAGVYLVGRAMFLFAEVPVVMNFIAWIGGFTAIFAASIAITQRQIKRILAYSTVSQLGYMMLALGVGSLSASFFHLMTHAFFKAMLFLSAGAVMHAMAEEADIFRMGGLRKKMPVTFAAMTIGVLAIAGIPPFAGFFSKDEILAAAAAVSTPLYVLAVVTAFMTAFYMARLLFVTFMGEPASREAYDHAHEVGWFMRLPLLVLAVLSVFSGMWGHIFGFGEWVRFGAAAHEGIDWAIAGSSTVLAVLAMGLAWKIYVAKSWDADELAARCGILYRLSFHKFYIDEIYAALIKVLVDGIARGLYWLDVYIVDGIVNGLGGVVRLASGWLSPAENGQAQSYAGVYLCGVIILLAYGVYFAAKIMAMLGGAF